MIENPEYFWKLEPKYSPASASVSQSKQVGISWET